MILVAVITRQLFIYHKMQFFLVYSQILSLVKKKEKKKCALPKRKLTTTETYFWATVQLFSADFDVRISKVFGSINKNRCGISPY